MAELGFLRGAIIAGLHSEAQEAGNLAWIARGMCWMGDGFALGGMIPFLNSALLMEGALHGN